MTVKLRPGLHYAPVPDGVYLGTAAQRLVIQGPPTLFRIVDVCVPLLEDGCAEDDLVAALGREAARPAVRRLLQALDQRGLLLRPELLSIPAPDRAVYDEHGDVLAQLEAEHADPYAAFAKLTAARVLLAGEPNALLPAARGLARAAVGALVLALPDPTAAAGLAAHLPGGTELAVLEAAAGGTGARALRDAAHGAADRTDPDARTEVAIVTASGDPVEAAGTAERLPTIPVHLGEQLCIVGPVMHGAGAAGSWSGLCDRVRRWAWDMGTEAVARPVADALAGALAGHAAYRRIAGFADPAQAHVIHGATLTAERIALAVDAPGGADAAGPVGLDDVEAVRTPPRAELLEAVQRLGSPWIGVLRTLVPEDLPQLPLAVAELRVLLRDRVVALARFGADQQIATLAAALAALRARAADGCAPEGVGAAGPGAARWLLDGALRLLAPRTGPAGEVDFDDLPDGAARDLWRVVEDYELVGIGVRWRALPGVGWRMAEVFRRADGETVAAAWGADPDRAAAAALAMAVSRLQALRVRGADLVGPGLDTASAAFESDEAATALLGDLLEYCRVGGLRVTGVPAAADPLLGRSGFCHGVVSLVPAAPRVAAFAASATGRSVH